MDKYKVKWTFLEREIFSLLCKRAGTTLTQREIAKIIRTSPTAAGTAIRGLGSYVVIVPAKTMHLVSFNDQNPSARIFKQLENLRQLYTSGLVDYLITTYAGSTILLFGSYNRGEDILESDIDIAIIGRTPKQLSLEAYEQKLERKINIQYYHSWKEIQSPLKNNILNGTILHGSVNL